MTQFTGLSEREAALSREKYGSNAIPESEPTTFWAEVKATFQDPMIRILLASCVFPAMPTCMSPPGPSWR